MRAGARWWSGRRNWKARERNCSLLVSAWQLQAHVRRHPPVARACRPFVATSVWLPGSRPHRERPPLAASPRAGLERTERPVLLPQRPAVQRRRPAGAEEEPDRSLAERSPYASPGRRREGGARRQKHKPRAAPKGGLSK